MKKILLIALVCSFAFASCDKDDNDCTTSVATVSGTYKVTSIKYKDSPGGTEVDWYALLQPCEKDDLWVLNSNGTFNYQDAGTVCDPNGTYTSDWSLSGNTITIDGETATISSFNCSTLVAYADSYINPGDRITITYVKQ